MKIDITKKYRYRAGGLARILCVDALGDQPVVSVTEFGLAVNHLPTGEHTSAISQSPLDLIEVREPREWWAPHYYLCTTKEAARTLSGTREAIRVREIIE